eukprot:gene3859-4459_t
MEELDLERQLENLPETIAALSFSSSVKIPHLLKAAVTLREILSVEKSPPRAIQQIIESGVVVPRLIELLQMNDHPDLQFEAAWVLTYIANGSSQQTQILENNLFGLLETLPVIHVNTET